MRAILTFLLLLLTVSIGDAQTITGVVADAAGGATIGDVAVQNIHTDAGITTDARGSFTIAAKPGELVEFRKLGYKTARLRIVSAAVPFYRIILEPGAQELEEISVRNQFRDFKHDSMRFRELFKKQLEYPVLTGWRAIQSPFTAMGKTNQQMISFQREYEWLERQKFVDYHFNEKLIANLTGLKGDSVVRYMSQYRPSYEMIRSMHEYDYFIYVKRTVAIWRQRQRLGPGRSRGGG
jgi:hypothetical protein